MTRFSKASEVITQNDHAVVVFTRDDKFYFDDLGNGTTGNWKVDPVRLDKVDKGIIYLRMPGNPENRIFIGNYAGLQPSNEAGRYIIRFSHLKGVGFTYKNWPKFSEGGQTPLRYINLRIH